MNPLVCQLPTPTTTGQLEEILALGGSHTPENIHCAVATDKLDDDCFYLEWHHPQNSSSQLTLFLMGPADKSW